MALVIIEAIAGRKRSKCQRTGVRAQPLSRLQAVVIAEPIVVPALAVVAVAPSEVEAAQRRLVVVRLRVRVGLHHV